MSVTKEDLGGTKSRLRITVPADVFQDAVERAYRRNRKQYTLPGFRRGNVPRAMIERQYGSDVFYKDALDALVPQSLAEAVVELELELAGQPTELLIEEIGRDTGVVFTAIVYELPEVELGPYEGLELTKHEYKVRDEEVDAAVEEIRAENGRWTAVDRPAENGDSVVVAFTGKVDGEVFEGGSAEHMRIALGSGMMIEGFEEQIVGMRPGEDRSITITFPEDYGEQSLAGKDAVFDVHVQDVEQLELPELDDDFAQDVSSFDTLEEYRESVRKEMQDRIDRRNEDDLESDLVAQIVTSSTVDVPPPMTERQIVQDLQNLDASLRRQNLTLSDYLSYHKLTPEMLREQMTPAAEQTVKTSMVISALVQELGTSATDEEVDAELDRMAEMSGITPEQARESMTSEQRARLADQLSIKKTLRRLEDLAVITVVEDDVPSRMPDRLSKAPDAKSTDQKTEDNASSGAEAPNEETSDSTAPAEADAESTN